MKKTKESETELHTMTVRIPQTLAAETKIECIRRRVKLRTAVAQGLALWLKQKEAGK
jgi:hypothetical protein